MKLSILTISYNSAKYLEKSIVSVLNQNYKNWEHIIIDGGSTDGTVEILRKYPHLKWISEPDKGQSDAMNKAFAISSGDIIGYLNADDYYNPNEFKHVVEAFNASTADMIVGDICIDYGDRKEIRTPTTKYLEVIDYKKDLFPANPVSYFYKRQVQISFGDFPIENHMTMDLDFLFYAYKFFKVTYVPEILGVFNMDGDNKTSIMNVRDEQRKALFRFHNKYDKKRLLKNIIDEKVFQLKRKIKKTLNFGI